MLAIKNAIELELDGWVTKWQSFSDLGETAPAGESGIDPKTGKIIKSGGVTERPDLVCTKLYDAKEDKPIVDLIISPPSNNPWKDGSKRGTVTYLADNVSYILSGLKVTSYSIPGKDGLSSAFATLSVTFSYDKIDPV